MKKITHLKNWYCNVCMIATFALLTSSSFAQFKPAGNASFTYDNICNGDCYELTPDTPWKSGAIWNENTIDLNNDFEICFNAYFGTKDLDGADGISFVFQNDPRGTLALGGWGGYIGYGPTHPGGPGGIDPGLPIVASFAIEFDTHDNTIGGPGGLDIAADHISLVANGDVLNPIDPPIQADVIDADIEDGECHKVCISWDAATKTLEVTFDNVLRISKNIDLTQDIFGGNSSVTWGLTAATGSYSNRQVVCFESCCGSFTHNLNSAVAWDWRDGEIIEQCCFRIEVAHDYQATDCDIVQIEVDVPGLGLYPMPSPPVGSYVAFPQKCIDANQTPMLIPIKFYDTNGDLVCEKIDTLDCGNSQLKRSPTIQEATYPEINLICLPNPASGQVKLTYTIPGEGPVVIELISVDGKIFSLVNETATNGEYSHIFNSQEYDSGLYLIRMRFKDEYQYSKIIFE